MGIFSKIFKRNRNTVSMTAEEAFVPETEPEREPEAPAAPEAQPQPEVQPEQPAAVETPEPEQPKVTFTRGLKIYAAVVNPDDAPATLRPFLVEKSDSVSEDSVCCRANLKAGLTLCFSRAEDDFVDRLTRKYGVIQSANIAQVLMQVSLFNLCVQVKITADSRDLMDEATPVINEAARLLNGFVEWDETGLHTNEGKLLIDTQGNTELETFAPETVVPEPVDPNVERAERSFDEMRAHGISYDSGKSVQILPENALIRPAQEIAQRAACLFACVLVASAYMSPKEISAPAAFAERALKRLDEQYGVMSKFTPKEKAYIRNPQYHNAFFMRSESCAVLLWALGYMELPWPDRQCDIDKIGSVLKNTNLQKLVSISRPLEQEKLLDMQDLTFRLHSYCVLRENTAGISEDAVYERHYALNWLLGVNGINGWDDVIPKT